MGNPTQAQAFSFEITLISQSTKDIAVNPTIAAGDFKIFKDGALDGNLDTLPLVSDPSHGVVTVAVSAAEVTGCSRICIQAKDVADAEWYGNSWTFFLDTPRGEPGQGAPPVSATPYEKIDYLYAERVGKKTNDGSFINVYAADGSTVLFRYPVSESGGVTTIGAPVTGL